MERYDLSGCLPRLSFSLISRCNFGTTSSAAGSTAYPFPNLRHGRDSKYVIPTRLDLYQQTPCPLENSVGTSAPLGSHQCRSFQSVNFATTSQDLLIGVPVSTAELILRSSAIYFCCFSFSLGSKPWMTRVTDNAHNELVVYYSSAY